MKNIDSSFTQNARWKALEVIACYALYLAHNTLLFSLVDTTFFGSIGALYGIVYGTAAATRFGLEASLGPRYQYWSRSKSRFRAIWSTEVLTTLVIALPAIVGLFLICKPSFLNGYHLILAIMITSCELIRKIVKMFLNLLLDNQRTAYVELVHMAGFMAMVWSSWFWWKQISFATILVPHLIMSLITVATYLALLNRWYNSLPEVPLPLSTTTSHTNRALLWLHQIIQQCFSSNFLIPLVASMIDLRLAGEWYLLASSFCTIKAIIERIYGSLFFVQFSLKIPPQTARAQVTLFSSVLIFCLSLLFFKQGLTTYWAILGFTLITIEYAISALEQRAVAASNFSMIIMTSLGTILLLGILLALHVSPALFFCGLISMRLATIAFLQYHQKISAPYESAANW